MSAIGQPLTIPSGNIFSSIPLYVGVGSVILLLVFSLTQINNLDNGSSSQNELKTKFSLTVPFIGSAIAAAIAGFFLFSQIELKAPFKYETLMLFASVSFFFSLLAIVLSSVQVTLK